MIPAQIFTQVSLWKPHKLEIEPNKRMWIYQNPTDEEEISLSPVINGAFATFYNNLAVFVEKTDVPKPKLVKLPKAPKTKKELIQPKVDIPQIPDDITIMTSPIDEEVIDLESEPPAQAPQRIQADKTNEHSAVSTLPTQMYTKLLSEPNIINSFHLYNQLLANDIKMIVKKSSSLWEVTIRDSIQIRSYVTDPRMIPAKLRAVIAYFQACDPDFFDAYTCIEGNRANIQKSIGIENFMNSN